MTSSDELARLRTKLANERTLLSYVRTGLAVGAGGGSLIAFVESAPAQVLGWALCAIGLVGVGIGIARFRAVDREI